jgi:hypothetical protein
MKFKIHSAHDNIVVYSQAFYPHWFYNIGKEKKAALNLDPFISAPVKKGVNEIEFYFEPKNVKLGMLISLVFFIIIVITLLLSTDLFRSFSRQP